MKYFVLVLAFVAVAHSYGGERNIQINEEGIVITGANGRQITISNSYGGKRNIDIAVSAPNLPTKRIQITGQNEVIEDRRQNNLIDIGEDIVRSKRSRSSDYKGKSDILQEILRDYQGVVSEGDYSSLLARVEKAVQKGEVSGSILDVLRGFEQNDYWGQGQVQQPGIVPFLRPQVWQQQGSLQTLVETILDRAQVQGVQREILRVELLQLLLQNVEQYGGDLYQGRVGLTRQVVPGYGYGQELLGRLGYLGQSGIGGRLPFEEQLFLRRLLSGVLQQEQQLRQVPFVGVGQYQEYPQYSQLVGVLENSINGQDDDVRRLVRDILIQQQLERQQGIEQGVIPTVFGQQRGIGQVVPPQYVQGRYNPTFWRDVLRQQQVPQQLGVYPQGLGKGFPQVPVGYVRYGSGQGYEQFGLRI